jgi:tetratricopeptide (TPR) repeat protein
MYTQIFKEILLTIDFNEQHIKDLTNYYRDNFSINDIQLNNIEQFQRDYDKYSPIWWYTHECWFYSVLNRALRMMEVDTIIKMGFFIRDLHQQIVQLHSEQLNEEHQSEQFILYRGQGLSTADFDKMRRTQGGLISFNNFLSTSKDPTVALGFARGSLANPASVGIVFVLTIDPSIKSTPFASINNVSYYKTEEEILFSMHTVFRIDNMMQIEGDQRLWHIDLVQSNDNDPQLNNLTRRIREEIRGKTEWDQMGKLLIKLGQFNKADELYEVLLDQTYNDHEKTHFYHQPGWSKTKQKQYNDAIIFYEKALQIKREILPPNHHSFAVSFNDIGSVFEKMNQYSQALLYYEKGLEIEQNIVSLNQSGLGYAYSHIGSVYAKMGEYSKALLFHEQAVEIRENLPPLDQGTLAQSYNNISSVHVKINNYSEALSSYEKALEIQKKILPSNHPDLAQSYSDIGFVYGKMGKHLKAR